MPHAASMPCELTETRLLGHAYRVATLYYVLVVVRYVDAHTNYDVLRYTSPDLSSCLVSFASAGSCHSLLVHSHSHVARVLQKKHADPNEPVLLGETREMHRPFGRQRKTLDTNTERVVSTLLVTLSIRINMRRASMESSVAP